MQKKVMQKLIVTICLIFIANISFSQELGPNTYNFWLGKWDAKWVDGQGNVGEGTNHISLITGDKVLHENFQILKGSNAGYLGTSISVFNPNTKVWHQTWMDNQGGNIVFTGEVQGDKRIFKTAMQNTNGQQIQSRMVFYNIKEDGFTWDWERTTDGGQTWNLNWRIEYTKMK